MRPSWQSFFVVMLFAGQLQAQTETPLSAIDWLSESVIDIERQSRSDSPTSTGVFTHAVTVTSLDQPEINPIGIIPTGDNRFSQDIWLESEVDVLSTNLSLLLTPNLPSLRALLIQLLIAEALPPQNQTSDNEYFLARIDKLLDLGELRNAQLLLELAEPESPELFRRYFDVMLLTGQEDSACEIMRSQPSVGPTYPARIFCLARNGDWPAAALTLNTHKALGDISDEEDLLLGLFLDPELAELEYQLPTPSKVTPLVFRIREAIGENLSTSSLPIAFAYADLRDIAGWKAQLEAAERLARAGALEPTDLWDLYTKNRPSASGGVWNRAATVQKLESVLNEPNIDENEVSTVLITAWKQFQSINAESIFSRLYSARMANLSLNDEASKISDLMIALANSEQDFLIDATGPNLSRSLFANLANQLDPSSERTASVLDGLSSQRLLSQVDSRLSHDKFGEAALHAIKLAQSGANGNFQAIAQSLIILRRLGFDDLARQVAMEFLILDRKV